MSVTHEVTPAPKPVVTPGSVGELDELLKRQTNSFCTVDVGDDRPAHRGILMEAEVCYLRGAVGTSRVWLLLVQEARPASAVLPYRPAGRYPVQLPLWMIRRITTSRCVIDCVPLAGEMSPFAPAPEVF